MTDKEKELLKAKGEEEDTEAEGEEEEGEEMEESSKSEDLSEDDLQKSLARLEAVAKEGDRTSRKDALLSKAQQEELSKSEKDELFGLLGNTISDEPTFADEVTKSMEENETMQKALDVSDYLQEQHQEMTKSLTVLADRIEKSDSRQHDFNLLLANATANIGNLVKALSERLGVIEAQPVRKPKSQGVPMEKSFAGSAPDGEQLSKSQILTELDLIAQDIMIKGESGVIPEGVDILTEASKYEQFNAINPTLLATVQKRIKDRSVA